MSDLIKVPFEGREILAVVHEGAEYVVIKPLCEALGIDPNGQRQRILKEAWGKTSACNLHVDSLSSQRGNAKHFCLSRKRLMMWLATISIGSVRNPKARAFLVTLQDKAADVLDAFFAGGPPTQEVLRRMEQMLCSSIEREGVALARIDRLERLLLDGGSGIVGQDAAQRFIKSALREVGLYEALDRTGKEGDPKSQRKRAEERLKKIVKHSRAWALLPRDRLGEAQGALHDMLKDAKRGAAERNAQRQQNLI